jgi:hypothetical protein
LPLHRQGVELRVPAMTVHVGEISTQIETRGVGGAATEPATAGPPKEWDERERHRALTEEEARRCARLSAAGFDG